MAQGDYSQADYPGGMLTGLAAAAAAGVAAFVWLAVSSPREAWLIYLVNFLACSGVITGAVALAAIFEVSEARWLRLARRAGECCASALPVLPVLFLLTLLGSDVLMPWTAPSSGVHKPWLDLAAVYWRGTIGLTVVAALGMAFMRKSARQGFGAARGLAMAYLIAYVLVTSIQAVDLLMALDPHWVSSLLGAHVFAGNIYAGIGFCYLLTFAGVSWLGAGQSQSHEFQLTARGNMGKMLFSFAMIWMYMFWSQHLVIWYGNLPHETGYMTLRLASKPWQTLAYTILALCFLLPFLLLIPRGAKRNQPLLLALSAGVIAGIWLERFMLAAPALLPSGSTWIGLRAAVVTIGFCAGFLLMVLTSLKRVPILEMEQARASE